jgi:ubiquinone/menaquinone biosynthesis C-methylase UbiE
MQNREQWSPGKYVIRNGRLRSTRDSSKLKTASRLVTDLVAARYDEAIRTYARGDLIDLGCGNVPLFLAYKDRVNSVTCVDWPATRHKVDHLDHELDLTENLPFPDNTYSTIILSDVLEHIPSPGQLLSEMHRILAPGGVAIINTPFLYWVHEAPHDYYRYTEYALQRFSNDAGFRVISLEPIGGLPEVLADFIAKKPRVIPIIGHLFRNLGKSLSRKTSKRFPMGYFMIVEKQQ